MEDVDLFGVISFSELKARSAGPCLVIETVLVTLEAADKEALYTMLIGGSIGQALSKSGLCKDELTKCYGDLTCAMLNAQRDAAKQARDKMIEMPDRVRVESAKGDKSQSVGDILPGDRFLETRLVLRTALLKLTDEEKAAMETALNGGTFDQALAVGGMTEDSFGSIYNTFGKVLRKVWREAATAAFDLMLEMPSRMMTERMDDLNRSMGLPPWNEIEARKTKVDPEMARVKPRKIAAIAKARVYPRKGLSLDEWAGKITSVIHKIWEKEMNLLQAHERVTFDEWRTV